MSFTPATAETLRQAHAAIAGAVPDLGIVV
jgi:hypothetical protein